MTPIEIQVTKIRKWRMTASVIVNNQLRTIALTSTVITVKTIGKKLINDSERFYSDDFYHTKETTQEAEYKYCTPGNGDYDVSKKIGEIEEKKSSGWDEGTMSLPGI